MVIQKQPKLKKQEPFYHRKLARSGGSRYLAVGKLLPEDWLYVRVIIREMKEKACILEIIKLA